MHHGNFNKKGLYAVKKYVLFIIVIVFALPAAFASKSNEVNIVQSTMAFAFEVIYSEFLICRYTQNLPLSIIAGIGIYAIASSIDRFIIKR